MPDFLKMVSALRHGTTHSLDFSDREKQQTLYPDILRVHRGYTDFLTIPEQVCDIDIDIDIWSVTTNENNRFEKFPTDKILTNSFVFQLSFLSASHSLYHHPHFALKRKRRNNRLNSIHWKPYQYAYQVQHSGLHTYAQFS